MKESKKAAELKMVTVDQYMEENQLNEMEFRRHLFQGDIQLFAWVSNLPIVAFWPSARYYIKNLDHVDWTDGGLGYVDLFRNRSYIPALLSGHGLLGLSDNDLQSVLFTGSVEFSGNPLEQSVFITRHMHFTSSKERLGSTDIVSLRGMMPKNVTRLPSSKIIDYPSDLFDGDSSLKLVMYDTNPDFDFLAWRVNSVYRKDKIEHVKSTFEAVVEGHKFEPKLYSDKRAFVAPVTFEVGNLLSEVTSLPNGSYRISTERGSVLEPNQCRLELTMPPPVILRSQLMVFDINEDMYSPSGKVEDIKRQDELAPEEPENELDYQSELYTNEKRLLVLKGWLGASKWDVSKPLNITRKKLWDELSTTDREIFPPTSESTIKDFFQSQDLCQFKRGRRAGK